MEATTLRGHVDIIESVLGRIRNCVGEMVASSYVHQPNHIAMQFSCFVYTVILHVPLWLQMCCTVSGPSYSTKGEPYSIIHRLVGTQFS